MNFSLRIITPTGAMPAREIEFLDVPAGSGRMTLLAGHQPTVCLLSAGGLRLRDEQGREERWMIEPGVLHVERSAVTVLTRRVEAEAPPH